MQKTLEHTVKGEDMESNEQIRYLNVCLNKKAKQNHQKLKHHVCHLLLVNFVD